MFEVLFVIMFREQFCGTSVSFYVWQCVSHAYVVQNSLQMYLQPCRSMMAGACMRRLFELYEDRCSQHGTCFYLLWKPITEVVFF